MSHYEALGGDEKRFKEIEDIKQYLGAELFAEITARLKDAVRQGATLDDLRFPLAFAGVQGYPVKAWYELIVAALEQEKT